MTNHGLRFRPLFDIHTKLLTGSVHPTISNVTAREQDIPDSQVMVKPSGGLSLEGLIDAPRTFQGKAF